jgi:hypothetical protein
VVVVVSSMWQPYACGAMANFIMSYDDGGVI